MATPNLVGPGPRADYELVRESYEYNPAVRSIDIEVVRMAEGSGATSVLTNARGRFVATSVSIGFPMLSYTRVPDDRFTASVVTRSPAGASWCGQPIDCGDVLIHGPETSHTAFNPDGLEFTFALLPIEDVRYASEGMESDVPDLTGRLIKLFPTPATRRLGSVLAEAGGSQEARRSRRFGPAPLLSLDACVADSIDSVYHDLQRARNRAINDSEIVNACIEHATSIGRGLGIAEMRLAAHVSERRLRYAFNRVCGVPPGRFFRLWALDQVRRRLVDTTDDRIVTVGMVATDLGFRHLGRFAAYYHTQYGEWPSETLARSVGKDRSAGRR